MPWRSGYMGNIKRYTIFGGSIDVGIGMHEFDRRLDNTDVITSTSNERWVDSIRGPLLSVGLAYV
jgi:hypothetical protein